MDEAEHRIQASVVEEPEAAYWSPLKPLSPPRNPGFSGFPNFPIF